MMTYISYSIHIAPNLCVYARVAFEGVPPDIPGGVDDIRCLPEMNLR